MSKQIADLRARAEKLKRQEVGEVITKIKKAITAYGITAHELFGQAVTTKTRAAAKKSKSAVIAKYSDGSGNVWGGRGPRPQWLRDALAKGKQLADFLTGGHDGGNGVAPTAKSTKIASAKQAGTKKGGRKEAAAKKISTSRVQYTDGTNTWLGRGPRPRWLKEALAGGRTLDDLRVH